MNEPSAGWVTSLASLEDISVQTWVLGQVGHTWPMVFWRGEARECFARCAF